MDNKEQVTSVNALATEREETVYVDKSDVDEFLDFLSSEETYLDTGLGAFHTDNHGNW